MRLKAYMFYFKDKRLNRKYLYAFTSNKKHAKLFQQQRDMKAFTYKKVDMHETEFRALSYRDNKSLMIEDYLTDEDSTTVVIATNEESNKLSETYDYMSTMLDYYRRPSNAMPLKKKYRNAIRELVLAFYDDEDIVDTYKVFIEINRPTFDHTVV